MEPQTSCLCLGYRAPGDKFCSKCKLKQQDSQNYELEVRAGYGNVANAAGIPREKPLVCPVDPSELSQCDSCQ